MFVLISSFLECPFAKSVGTGPAIGLLLSAPPALDAAAQCVVARLRHEAAKPTARDPPQAEIRSAVPCPSLLLSLNRSLQNPPAMATT